MVPFNMFQIGVNYQKCLVLAKDTILNGFTIEKEKFVVSLFTVVVWVITINLKRVKNVRISV